jgi:hypothetical protein
MRLAARLGKPAQLRDAHQLAAYIKYSEKRNNSRTPAQPLLCKQNFAETISVSIC